MKSPYLSAYFNSIANSLKGGFKVLSKRVSSISLLLLEKVPEGRMRFEDFVSSRLREGEVNLARLFTPPHFLTNRSSVQGYYPLLSRIACLLVAITYLLATNSNLLLRNTYLKLTNSYLFLTNTYLKLRNMNLLLTNNNLKLRNTYLLLTNRFMIPTIACMLLLIVYCLSFNQIHIY